MKFIADSMLGRLARWLRLLGYDTLYFRHIDKSLLLRLAREEARVLLTRDTRIVKIRGISNCLLLKDNDPFEQLKSVITAFQLSPALKKHESDTGETEAIIYSRCSLCNTLLIDAAKEEARGSVPEYVYATTERFKKCVTCNRFYWQGTHRKKLLQKMESLI